MTQLLHEELLHNNLTKKIQVMNQKVKTTASSINQGFEDCV